MVRQQRLTAPPLEGADALLLRGFELALRTGFVARMASPKSVTTYVYGVRSLMRYLREKRMPSVVAVTREHAQEWMLVLRSTREPATARVYLLGVRTFFRWLIDEGERKDDPTERISAPTLPDRVNRPLTQEEIRAVIRLQNPRTLVGLRNIALFYFLLDTGLRREEAAAVLLPDVDWRHGTIRLRGKGAKDRIVRIGTTTQRAIDLYLRRRAETLPHLTTLWHTRSGYPFTGLVIARIHKDVERELGFDFHPHRWRHTAAQNWLDAGMSREDVRILLGHADERTLRIYTRYTDAARAIQAHEHASVVDRLGRIR